MKKEIRYYVIGGQYDDYNYGGTPTLLGAKRLATANEEYWDNWQGWYTPSIYRAEDCEEGNSFYGRDMYPKLDAMPVAWRNRYTKKWEEGR